MAKEIELTNGGVALVDLEDYALIKRHEWRRFKDRNVYYAVTSIGSMQVTMHRIVFGGIGQHVIDHIDFNGLNNQKSNLRLVDKSTNQQRATVNRRKGQYRGVDPAGRKGRWYARIQKGNKLYRLGVFNTKKSAALAYDRKALELYGNLAFLNFPYLAKVKEQ